MLSHYLCKLPFKNFEERFARKSCFQELWLTFGLLVTNSHVLFELVYTIWLRVSDDFCRNVKNHMKIAPRTPESMYLSSGIHAEDWKFESL